MTFMQTEEWHKNGKCHNCGKKGHIRPNCLELEKTRKPPPMQTWITMRMMRKKIPERRLPSTRMQKKDLRTQMWEKQMMTPATITAVLVS